ncbi:MAG TPA: DUF6677 family protein, partial [Planctomycetaceae bacterium]|nr:DUF6677 family protein [Planctomycetaceae bacterium]
LLSGGQVVFLRWDAEYKSWGYLAQFWVGLPALPALVQAQRTDPLNDRIPRLTEPLSAEFTGELLERGASLGVLHGHIEIESTGFGEQGLFRGTFAPREGPAQPVELVVGGEFQIEREILGGRGRHLRIRVREVRAGGLVRSGLLIVGDVPRSFWNWFQAPPGERQLQSLHRRLGKFYELAAVFTWIAGLLNILAIWDALEGPAYGYGYEGENAESTASDRQNGATPPAAREPAAAAVSTGSDRPGSG